MCATIEEMKTEMNAESVRRSLQITVSDACVETFLSLPPETLALIRASLDDVQRMVLMVIDRCIALGLKARPAQQSEALCFADTKRSVCITLDADLLFLECREDNNTQSHGFTANYYGQMQLYQWLDALREA